MDQKVTGSINNDDNSRYLEIYYLKTYLMIAAMPLER
jgi:hypothetical protein